MSSDDKKKIREADELARTGQQHMKQKPADYMQAIECYTQAISLNPTVAKYFFMRGQCYKNKNQHQKCLSDYTMALRIEPKDKSYLEARGTCLRRLNMPVEAVRDYTAAIAIDDKQANYYQYRALAYCSMVPPEYSNALADLELSYNLSENKFKAMLQFNPPAQRGFVKRRVGRPEEAVEDLKRAVALDVKSREAHNHLGMALLDAGFLDQALESFEQAAELSDVSFSSILNNNKALTLFRLGRKEEALACFLDALSSAASPEAALFYNRGTVYLKLTEWTAAASDFECAIGINAEMPVYHYAFSVALERIGRRNEAYASLQKALELSPDFAPALHELCALQFLDGKFSDSEATASSLLALRPSQGGFPAIFGSRVTMLQPLFAEHLAWLLLPRDYAESFTLRGQARIALKNYDGAIADFCNALSAGLADPKIYNLRALCYRCLKKYELAETDLTHAIAADSNNIDFLVNRSQCYYETKEFDAAVTDLTVAIGISTSMDGSLFYHRGLAYYSKGSLGDAATDLEAALTKALDETLMPSCFYNLGLCKVRLGNFEAAARALNAAVELRPSCIEYIHERAKALQMYGRHADAILDFTTVLNARPRFANARFRRAFSYKSLGQFDESAKDFEDARQLQPHNPRLVVNYFQMRDCPFIELVCPGQELEVDV